LSGLNLCIALRSALLFIGLLLSSCEAIYKKLLTHLIHMAGRRIQAKVYIWSFVVLLAASPVFAQVTGGTRFVEFRLNDLGTILIPETMELQSGAYKRLSNQFSKDAGYDVSGEVIFQQKGLNQLDGSGRQTYARVMISTEVSEPGTYDKLTGRSSVTASELRQLDSFLKNQMDLEFAKQNQRLIRWDGATKAVVNGQNAVKISYVRQLESNPTVYVQMYFFQDAGRMHKLTLSYRLRDESLWKDALETVKNSFKIATVR
jgi:hypothetical protein